MRTMFRGAAALATAATAVVALSGAAQARPADTWDGCPSGAVCIYGENVDPSANPHPTQVFWSYGAHNLSNQYGWHWVTNNQTGGATASLCKAYNGGNCDFVMQPQWRYRVDLTPVNSITLNRP
ncbi:hypothetical protein RKE30_17220 [Streptomyces sp. Li-HN-5-11]|jgi:hypothetical protein|uniref:hypothetical protein n=1 Tax=Streptomyces sp. Li-HN-5-11 TaxID=3075432 RepID=UPI0028AB8F5F|nr:hypothetical protein [Streptomyces sp. Li-HN-5-11]WNM32027.1 hypothetical protein RKE30_17220 [Streptomyces sp. Li-HN-5-11]WOP39202.1 hypothetical protein RKE32_38340 [Streptomyces sp. Li-HN-5-13]